MPMQQEQRRFAAIIADPHIERDAVGSESLEAGVANHRRSLVPRGPAPQQIKRRRTINIGGLVDVPQRWHLAPSQPGGSER